MSKCITYYLATLALLAAACVKDDPSYCDAVDGGRPCPVGMKCGQDHRCVAAACEMSAACAPESPICDTGKKECRKCTSMADDADCALRNMSTPLCDPAGGQCVTCRDNKDCMGKPGTTLCSAGQCVGCRDSKDCNDPMKPICDGMNRICRACQGMGDDGGCKARSPATPLCDAMGTCSECRTSDDCKDPAKKVCAKSNIGLACTAGCDGDGDCRDKTNKCCNKVCIDPTDNSDHCGGCNTKCSMNKATCCAMMCQDLKTDLMNCGMCATKCAIVANATPTCTDGGCGATCVGDFQNCDGMLGNGCEINTATDVNNCGGCSKKCPVVTNGTPGCSGKMCGIGACNMGFDDCDKVVGNGCEITLASDVNNCGACGKKCTALPNASTGCAMSMCGIGTCNAGFENCDMNALNGCEVDLAKDINNCGKCGVKCAFTSNANSGSPGCMASACIVINCMAGVSDCNKTFADACEANTQTDPMNCGGCGKTCKQFEKCKAGACRKDSVIVVGAAQKLWTDDVVKTLSGTSAFSKVDFFDAFAGTPTEAQLTPYDVALVFCDKNGFADAVKLGNVLTNYFNNQKGRIVVAAVANADAAVMGTFATDLALITPSPSVNSTAGIQMPIPATPFTKDVTGLSALQAFRGTAVPANGGTVMVKWDDGKPLVISGVVKGRNRVDLNFFPPSFNAFNKFWVDEGDKRLRNALLYGD